MRHAGTFYPGGGAADPLGEVVQDISYVQHEFRWCDPQHPFAQRFLLMVTDDILLIRAPAVGALQAIISNHVVSSRVIFPGTAYLETARAVAASSSKNSSTASLKGIFFVSPFVIEAA